MGWAQRPQTARFTARSSRDAGGGARTRIKANFSEPKRRVNILINSPVQLLIKLLKVGYVIPFLSTFE